MGKIISLTKILCKVCNKNTISKNNTIYRYEINDKDGSISGLGMCKKCVSLKSKDSNYMNKIKHLFEILS